MTKLTIYKRQSVRYTGTSRAAKALGVSRKAVDRFLRGEKTISRDKAARIVIKTIKAKEEK